MSLTSKDLQIINNSSNLICLQWHYNVEKFQNMFIDAYFLLFYSLYRNKTSDAELVNKLCIILQIRHCLHSLTRKSLIFFLYYHEILKLYFIQNYNLLMLSYGLHFPLSKVCLRFCISNLRNFSIDLQATWVSMVYILCVEYVDLCINL